MSTATDPRLAAAVPAARAGDANGRGLRLRTRLFLGSATLLVFTIGTAVAFLMGQAERIAEAEILRDLAAVPAVYESYRESQASARERQVRSLASEPGTKALLAEAQQHPETFHDSAREFAVALGARTVFFFDPAGFLVARSDRAPGEETGRDFTGVSWVDIPRLEQTTTSAFILEVSRDRALSLVAAAPVVQGRGDEQRLNGVIAASFEVSNERAVEVAQLTAGEAAYVANVAPRGATPEVAVLAATPHLGQARTLGDLGDLWNQAQKLFEAREPFRPIALGAGDDAYVATAIPVHSGSGELLATAIVARSRAAQMAPFRAIRTSLLAVGGVALLLSFPLSFALAQGLTGPLHKLAAAARHVARGELDVSLPDGGGGEVGALARAFAGMVGELKEKAQLEDLVADLQRRPGDITHRGLAPAGDGEDRGLGVGRLFAERYEIVSELGKGGMGTVFRARDRELKDEVALKVLQPGGGDTQGALDRLRQEMRIARQITHPNVVRAFDFGEAEGRRFLTMEYVPGTTLRELIDARGGLALTPALQVAKQICRGLAAVHRAGIIHGDLKPQNVMVMANGVAKLMDFGVARPRSGNQTDLLFAGTPIYMSPEQARGADLDDRSDIYAAGVMLFEMFTGQPPFGGRDSAEILQMHLNDPPPDPRTLRPGIPEPVSRLILMCLSKHRLQRPAGAAELERQLMRVGV